MAKSTRATPPTDAVIAGVDTGDVPSGDTDSLDEIEALKRMVYEAEDARRHAEQALADKDKLLGAMAHALRAPLASMLLQAQLLRDQDLLDHAALRRIGDSLERAVQHQKHLIERLFDNPSSSEHRPQADADQTTPMPRRSLDRPGKVKQYEALKDIRVLYIDDDFRTREAVLEVLELTGAHVALAASTADGMMALDTFKPHVILCDLAMPGEDGFAFIRKLRMHEGRSPQTPALAFTALASAADKRDALAAGFQLHLAKPIDIDRLRDSVLQLVALIGSGADRSSRIA